MAYVRGVNATVRVCMRVCVVRCKARRRIWELEFEGVIQPYANTEGKRERAWMQISRIAYHGTHAEERRLSPPDVRPSSFGTGRKTPCGGGVGAWVQERGDSALFLD